MKPFDLKKALAGEPVVTRDGRPATQLKHFAEVNNPRTLYGVVDGQVFDWDPTTGQGTFRTKDLFMATNKHTCQVAIWKSQFGDIVRYRTCDRRGGQIGDKSRSGRATLVAIQTIEWEE